MSRKLKIAVVGAGWVSRTRHLPALAAHDEVEVVGVIAPQHALDQLSTTVRGQLGISRVATSLESDVGFDADAVMIGTPPDTHAHLVGEALTMGKHVLVEKPMTMTTREADDLLAKAGSQSLTLAVVHNLQFCRAATSVRRQVETGRLGDIRATIGLQSSNHRRRLPEWYRELPAGLFTDESAHLIYLTQSFLPEARLTSLDVGPPIEEADNTPDMVSMSFRSNQNRPGALTMSFVGAVSEWAFIVQGEERTLAVDLFRDILVELPNDNGHLGRDVLRTSAYAVGSHLVGVARSGTRMLTHQLDYGNREVVRRFVAAVRTGEAPAGIAGVDGRRVVEVIEAAHRAGATD